MDYNKLQLRELKKIVKELEEINKSLGKLTRAIKDGKDVRQAWEDGRDELLDHRFDSGRDYPVFMEADARAIFDSFPVGYEEDAEDVGGSDCD